MKNSLIALELASMVVLTACVATLAGDAVSEANGKIDVFGGRVDGNDSGNLSGSYAFPINGHLGAQIDGLYGRLDNEDLFAGGGHIFWRDPEQALFGLTAAYGLWNQTDLWRIGAESEIYLQQFTLAVQAGNQSGDLGDEMYGEASLRYYLADDNLMLAAGGETLDGHNIAFADVECLTGLNGFSLFAMGAVGSDNYDLVLGGIRYYFGPDKSLLLRHRQDDPFNYAFSSFRSTISPSFNPSLFASPFQIGKGFGDQDATPE